MTALPWPIAQALKSAIWSSSSSIPPRSTSRKPRDFCSPKPCAAREPTCATGTPPLHAEVSRARELAPRDVVARAIVHELETTEAKDPVVYLDLTHLDAEHVKKRFPRIYSTCMEYNIDITAELIPIRPAAHYAMGGIRTDLEGRATLPGLFAAGEAAATGVHGANRLASNSLLEGLVFGARAGRAMRAELSQKHPAAASSTPSTPLSPDTQAATKSADDLIREVQNILWRDVGIVRTGHSLKNAIHELEALKTTIPTSQCRRCQEARNVWQTGLLIAKSALAREESRGAHYRTDFPVHDDKKFLKHSVVAGDEIRFE